MTYVHTRNLTEKIKYFRIKYIARFLNGPLTFVSTRWFFSFCHFILWNKIIDNTTHICFKYLTFRMWQWKDMYITSHNREPCTSLSTVLDEGRTFWSWSSMAPLRLRISCCSCFTFPLRRPTSSSRRLHWNITGDHDTHVVSNSWFTISLL